MKHVKLFEQFINERTDVKKLADKVVGDLDSYAQFYPDYIPMDAVDIAKEVLSKYPKLVGKNVEKAAKELRGSFEDLGILANDFQKLDVESIIMNALTESTLNEDLRSELKTYIKKNKKQIDSFADQDNWEGIYNMLLNDFGVMDGTDDADELKTIFNVVY